MSGFTNNNPENFTPGGDSGVTTITASVSSEPKRGTLIRISNISDNKFKDLLRISYAEGGYVVIFDDEKEEDLDKIYKEMGMEVKIIPRVESYTTENDITQF